MQTPLLSIIMPTFNRAWILPYSLEQIRDQIIRNSDKVELIVCVNAATDETQKVLREFKSPFFKCIIYDNHVDIGVSIARSIDNASGKYFILWGDDDIPAPFMVDQLLKLIEENPNIDCFHYNRLRGIDGENVQMNNLSVFYKEWTDNVIQYDNSEEFIKVHFRGMCFLSVFMLSLKSWNKGKVIDGSSHLGFEYLAPILYGISGGKCMYVNFPLCIQRSLKNPVYDKVWPAYLYLGIPRLLKCLEENKAISNWKEVYQRYLTDATKNGQFNDTLFGYINNMIYRASQDYTFYRKNIKEINSYQSSFVKRCCTYLVWLPSWINYINRFFIKKILRFIGKN